MTTPPPNSPSRLPTQSPDPLERRLAALTDWRDGEPSLHVEALRTVRADDGQGASRRAGSRPRWRLRPRVAAPVAVALVLAAVGLSQLWSGMFGSVRGVEAPGASRPEDPNGAFKSLVPASPVAAERDKSVDQDRVPTPDAAAERSVVRKATLDIESKDVRADFARVVLLVREARGEFVEASSLTGEGAAAHATITLRVAADRLGDVLNEIRQIGSVASEKSDGDDVTEQVVDLSARLRNEQKVEGELLKLLDARTGAPLKDVLEVREQVALVRGRIEQMTAQQERLGRGVALATILVIIRPEPRHDADAEHSRHETSALDYFAHRLDGAWHAGTRALADSAAAFVRVAVGGLVWWLLLATACGSLARWVRHAPGRAAREPAPAL